MSNDCGSRLLPAHVRGADRHDGLPQSGRSPFALAPDADLLFWTEAHRQVADTLRRGIEDDSPVILLTGGTGAGKTTLLHAFLADGCPPLTTGLLSFPGGGRDDLCARLLLAFGQQVPDGPTTSHFSTLQAFVAAEHEAGRRCVLVVDEAQGVTDGELEAVRLLTNLNTGRQTLLQVVLIGQPALRTRLCDARHAALAARIGADAHLSPMSEDDTAGYVRHRLAAAGGRADAFTPGALAAVHRVAQGVPRRTNLLCGLCVAEAGRGETPAIDAALVDAVAAAARRCGRFPGLSVPQELDEAARPEGNAAAPPSGGAPPVTEPVTAGVRKESAAASAADGGARPEESGAPAVACPPAASRPDHRQRWAEPVAPAANSPDRIEAGHRREPATGGGPGAGAQTGEPAPSAAEGLDDVYQLAFHAMASLADRESAGENPQRRESRRRKPPPPPSDAARGPGNTPQAPTDGAAAKTAPADRPRVGPGLALATAAVALAILGIGSHMAWSVHDALSVASSSRNRIAAATVEAPSGELLGPAVHRSSETAPLDGPDRAAGRGAVPEPRPTLTTPALPTIADPHVSASGLLSLALDLSPVDSDMAAIAFARAASRGHGRAAYYLAQLYETGDGVPRNLALARAWYAASGRPGAEARLASLEAGEPTDAVTGPRLLSAARTSDGMLELVWTSATDGSGVAYLIELLDGAGRTLHARRVAHSSYRLPAPEGELFWRVTVETPRTAAASDLQRIPSARPDGAGTSIARAAPKPFHVVNEITNRQSHQ